METISSIIRFVNADPIPTPEPVPGTQTGDFLGILFIAIAALAVLFFVCRKVFVNNSNNNALHSSVSSYGMLKKLIICAASIIAVFALIFSLSFTNAFAQNNQFNADRETGEVVTDEFINANVSEQNGSVTIDNARIVNNSDITVKFSDISTELLLTKELKANWKVLIDGNLVYDAIAGKEFPISQDIYLAPNEQIDVCISTDIDIKTAKELIENNVLKLIYTYDKIPEITGQVVNSKGKALAGIQADLYDSTGKIATVMTDEEGSYHFWGVFGNKYYVKFSDHNRQENKTGVEIGDKNIDFGSLTLLAKALISFNGIGTLVVDEHENPITQPIELKEKFSSPLKFKANITQAGMNEVSASDDQGFVYDADEDGIYVLDYCPEVDLLITCQAIEGLDYYTIEDTENKLGLKSISDDIAENGINSPYYGEFVTYAHNDEIWYSNSNGQQPDSVSPEDPSTADPLKCNQNYRNDFQMDESIIVPENQEIDRFLFLRVIGVYQDKEGFDNEKETGKAAGLTFQSIRSLPRAYAFSEDPNYQVNWWGSPNCFLRNDLSGNGVIFPKLSQSYQDNILQVSKKTQSQYNSSDLSSIEFTGDKLFIPSYSEMCSPGTEAARFSPYQYYMPGAEGQQYIWYKHHQIEGGSTPTHINGKIKDLGKVNSGENISGVLASTHQRTTYYADQYKFLLTNNLGFIYSYDTSFLQRSGIAPCFCFGTQSKFASFNLEAFHCNITNLDGEILSGCEQALAGQDFKFKIEKREAYPKVNVKCDGVEIFPDTSGVYTVSKAEGTYSIVAEGSGGPGDSILMGKVNIEKNLPSGTQVTPRENTFISFVTNDGSVLASDITDEEGNYNMQIDSLYLGTTGNLVLNYMPGVLTYKSDLITLVPGDIKNDVNMHGLDFYTFSELKEVSNWLSANPDLKTNPIYEEFYSYVENDVIWYSNSNGLQPETVNAIESASANPELCNQDYKCSFVNPNPGYPIGSELDQFLFLRIIGINHDQKADGNGFAGLTLQTIHATPFSVIMPSKDNSWWGDSQIRPMLQDSGSFYDEVNSNITKEICPVIKYSQADRTAIPNILNTTDKFFLLSYSEMWDKNGFLATAEHPWYGNTGIDTEGHTYLWHHLHGIDGGGNNEIISRLPVTNAGFEASAHQRAWQRSVYFDNASYFLATESHGSLLNFNYDFADTVFDVCFCI